MFGNIVGSLISAPIRLANIPVKLAQKGLQAADEAIFEQDSTSYRAPRRNTLDKLAKAIEQTCKESLDD